MLQIDMLISKLRSSRKKIGWSKNKLAKEAGIRESTLRKMNEQTWNPNTKTLRKIETALMRNK
jgi:ribosome-binding protein aMBF1 (putative translation factor)